MRNRVWPIGVLLVGLLNVAAVAGCVRAALPTSPLFADWPLYAGLLFVPYLLAAVGCRLATVRFVRLAAGLVVVVGLLLTAAALFDAWPTFVGGSPPAMPAFALLGGMLLLGQGVAGLAAVVGGWVNR